jgi:hypothetical protein
MKSHRLPIKPLAALAGALLLAQAASPTHAQSLIWDFNQLDPSSKTATDSSGNARHGTVAGNVSLDPSGLSGNAYAGFTSADSQVVWDSDSTTLGRGTSQSLSLWLKNPGDGGANAHVTIAGVGNAGAGNRAWEIWLGAADTDGNRTLNLSWGHWGGGGEFVTSSTLVSFEADAWYNLAFTWDRGSSQSYPFGFAIYLAKQGASSLGAPIFSGTVGDGAGAGPADTRTLYIGGNVAGYGPFNSAASFQAGYFGGVIDEVAFWQQLLTADELNARFLAYAAVPEPGAIALLAGALAMGSALIRRRRTSR